jgi:hypothetical protein
MEVNESHQEEEGDDSSKQEKTDSEWQPEDEKELDKNMMMKTWGRKSYRHIQYNIRTVQNECLGILP